MRETEGSQAARSTLAFVPGRAKRRDRTIVYCANNKAALLPWMELSALVGVQCVPVSVFRSRRRVPKQPYKANNKARRTDCRVCSFRVV